MQIKISARHGQLAAATQDKIREKVEKLPRLYDQLSSIAVIVDLEKSTDVPVEIYVAVDRAEDIVATDHAENLMAALDGAIHKVEQQLRKHKEKLKEHYRPGHRHTEVPTPDAEPE